MSKVAGIFYILMGGMIASMLAALGEFLYRSRIEARKGNVTSLLGSLAVIFSYEKKKREYFSLIKCLILFN